MILSRKKLYKIKKTKEQSRRRRKHRNKKKYRRRKKGKSRRKRRALNLRKRTMKTYRGGVSRELLSFVFPDSQKRLKIITFRASPVKPLANIQKKAFINMACRIPGLVNEEEGSEGKVIKYLVNGGRVEYSTKEEPQIMLQRVSRMADTEPGGYEGDIHEQDAPPYKGKIISVKPIMDPDGQPIKMVRNINPITIRNLNRNLLRQYRDYPTHFTEGGGVSDAIQLLQQELSRQLGIELPRQLEGIKSEVEQRGQKTGDESKGVAPTTPTASNPLGSENRTTIQRQKFNSICGDQRLSDANWKQELINKLNGSVDIFGYETLNKLGLLITIDQIDRLDRESANIYLNDFCEQINEWLGIEERKRRDSTPQPTSVEPDSSREIGTVGVKRDDDDYSGEKVEDFTGCQRNEDCRDNQKCDDGGECIDLTPEELQRRALNAQIQSGIALKPLVPPGHSESKAAAVSTALVPFGPETSTGQIINALAAIGQQCDNTLGDRACIDNLECGNVNPETNIGICRPPLSSLLTPPTATTTRTPDGTPSVTPSVTPGGTPTETPSSLTDIVPVVTPGGTPTETPTETPSSSTDIVPVVSPVVAPAAPVGSDGASKQQSRTSVDKSTLLRQLRMNLSSINDTLTGGGHSTRIFFWHGIGEVANFLTKNNFLTIFELTHIGQNQTGGYTARMLKTRLDNLVDLNNLSSLNSLVKLFYSCHSEEAFNREFSMQLLSPISILDFLIHIAEISLFTIQELQARIQSGSMYEPGVARVDGLSCVNLALDGIGSFYITAAALNNEMLDSIIINNKYMTQNRRVNDINLFHQLLDSSLFQYEDRSNVIKPILNPTEDEPTEDEKMLKYVRYMHLQILVPHFIESLRKIDAIRRGRPLGRTPVPVDPRTPLSGSNTTGDNETKGNVQTPPRVQSQGREIVPPYSDIKVGDKLQIAILQPATRKRIRFLLEEAKKATEEAKKATEQGDSNDEERLNLEKYRDKYGSAIGLPIKRDNFEQNYINGDPTLYTLVDVEVTSIEAVGDQVHYKILRLPSHVLDTLPRPYGIESGMTDGVTTYNVDYSKFSTTYRDYVRYDEIISVLNSSVTLRDTPIIGDVIDPNDGRNSDGGQTVPGTVVPNAGTNSNGQIVPGTVVPNAGTNSNGGQTVTGRVVPNAGTNSNGVLPSAPPGPFPSTPGIGTKDGETQDGDRGRGNRGSGDGGTGGDGGTENRGTGDGGQTGPRDNPPGDGGPTSQGNANQLPEDPLLYSQPQFGAWWQVYPGMYQPELRVMADTGVGVAEWLRHLGRPNPLPIIRGTGTGAGGGNGGEKISEDDNMIMRGGRRNRNKRKTFKKRRKRKNKTSKRKKKKKRRKKKN